MTRWTSRGLALLAGLAPALAAPFGHPGGPLPGNLDAVYDRLRADPYQLEILLSFGTTKVGTAGHIAVAVKDAAPDGDDLVYSANFYADRKEAHAEGYFTDQLMATIKKKEYLYGTSSTLSPHASFGLDYGEVYKRSLVGIRLRGVAPEEVRALQAFWDQLNADYRANAQETAYYPAPITYGYMTLNCAKTVALAFRHALGMRDVRTDARTWIGKIQPIDALTSNIPMETAMDIMEAGARRGWEADVVLYKKFQGSDYVNPKDVLKTPYGELADRFPSMLSLDFLQGSANYEDFDNLRAMNLLFELGRYALRIDPETKVLEVEKEKAALPWAEAEAKATRVAKKKSKGLLRRLLFRSWGLKLGGSVDSSGLYEFGPADVEP